MSARQPASILERANSDVVLIVDDVPDNLSVLHDALDESGYTVLVATDGEAALQRAAQALPDIVLLDAMMPGMDGFEVARRLKAVTQDGAHPDHLHDRAHRDRAPGGRVRGRRRRLRDQADQAQGSAGAHGRAPAGRARRRGRRATRSMPSATPASRCAASDGQLMWQTPLARELLLTYYGTSAPETPPAGARLAAAPSGGRQAADRAAAR